MTILEKYNKYLIEHEENFYKNNEDILNNTYKKPSHEEVCNKIKITTKEYQELKDEEFFSSLIIN